MNIHKFNILFVLKKNKTRINGSAPIHCRLTFKEKRKQFATGQFINPDYRNNKSQQVNPPDRTNYINSQVSLISQKLNQAFLLLQYKGEDFNVDDIYEQFLGRATS